MDVSRGSGPWAWLMRFFMRLRLPTPRTAFDTAEVRSRFDDGRRGTRS